MTGNIGYYSPCLALYRMNISEFALYMSLYIELVWAFVYTCIHLHHLYLFTIQFVTTLCRKHLYFVSYVQCLCGSMVKCMTASSGILLTICYFSNHSNYVHNVRYTNGLLPWLPWLIQQRTHGVQTLIEILWSHRTIFPNSKIATFLTGRIDCYILLHCLMGRNIDLRVFLRMQTTTIFL
jgi:hypothetical protein